MGIRIGANAKLFLNVETVDPYENPDWSEVALIRDLTAAGSMIEADASVRGSGGHKFTEPTLQDVGIDFEIVSDPEDDNFLLIKAAFEARTVLDVWISSGDVDDVDEPYIRADLKVTKFEESQPLAEINKVNVTMAPAYSDHPVILDFVV